MEIQQGYSRVAKSLHWLIALLIFSEYFIGITIDNTGWKWLHFQVGSVILVLVLCRIIWRVTHTYPAMDASLSRVNKMMAHAGHHTLYLLMFLLPVSGLTLVFTKGVPLDLLGIHFDPLMEPLSYHKRHTIKEVHEYMANGIFYLALLHALAAIGHQFIHKTPILSRMLPKSWSKFIE